MFFCAKGRENEMIRSAVFKLDKNVCIIDVEIGAPLPVEKGC